MKRKKVFSYLSNISLVLGLLIGGYSYLKIYLLKSNLPDGVCPINMYRPLIYIAIALLIISLILSYFNSKKADFIR